MIEQFWFRHENQRLIGVLQQPDNVETKWGAVLLPGFGQNKAGSYFIFTRLAQEISKMVPTLQFDYRGFGDSEGDLEECDLNTMVSDTEAAISILREKTNCENIVLIAAGIGNWIAIEWALKNKDSALVLLSPYKIKYPFEATWADTDDLIDTYELGNWSPKSEISIFFERLGEGLNRTRGLVLKKRFLVQLNEIEYEGLYQFKGPILEFHSINDIPFKEMTNKQTICLSRSDYKLLNPLDREQLITKVCEWIDSIIRR